MDAPGGGSPGAPIRGLIIDLDDTLYPREQFVRSGFAAVAKYIEALHGLSASLVSETLDRAYESGSRGREFQALCATHALSPSLIPGLVKVVRMHRPVLRLAAGAASALHTLRAVGGWRVVILTNGLPSVQRSKVAALGLAARVDDVVYAEEHAPGGKPSPAVFAEALRRLDLAPSRCVCAGDDPICDIAGARALHLRTVRLARREVLVDAAAEADAVIHTLRELPRVVSELLPASTIDVA
jgi:putative hydrolase of the HAD superfamily